MTELSRRTRGISQVYMRNLPNRVHECNDCEFYQQVPRPVGIMAKSYPARYEGALQNHPRAVCLFAQTGALKVTTDRRVWIVHPHRAVWLPPNYPHKMSTLDPVEMHAVYIRQDACPKHAPREPCVIQVSSLLRELVLRATSIPAEYDEAGHEGKIIALLLGEIDWSRAHVHVMARLQDSRLLAIERALASNPGDSRTLEQWADLAGASPRTLARQFLRETGISFRAWREQFRAMNAIPALMTGRPITLLANELGYESAGAFTAMFRRVMGMTPSRFLSQAFN